MIPKYTEEFKIDGHIPENSYIVFVKCMEEFDNNKELLKYCFLMKEYRHTLTLENKGSDICEEHNFRQYRQRHRSNVQQQDIIEERQFRQKYRMSTQSLVFSIEKNVEQNCPLVDNQYYIDINLSQLTKVSPVSLKSSFDNYEKLLTLIAGE